MSSRLTGKVRWFNDQKGYGFITPDDGSVELFVHQSEIQTNGFRSLAEGESVEYQIETDNNGRSRAVSVTGPNGASVQGTKRDNDGGYEHDGYSGGVGYGHGGGQWGGRGGGSGGCYNCGESGHMARDCSNSGSGGRYRGGDGDGSCFSCGESGHFFGDCPPKPR